MESGNTTIINEYIVDLTEVTTLLQEQKELLQTNLDDLTQLQTDVEVMIASIWILLGAVVGIAAAFLVYRLWRS